MDDADVNSAAGHCRSWLSPRATIGFAFLGIRMPKVEAEAPPPRGPTAAPQATGGVASSHLVTGTGATTSTQPEPRTK